MADDRGQMTEGRRQRADDRWQKTEDRRQMTAGRWQKTDDGRQMVLNSEVGMRPPASPSCRLYEPEAVGAIWAFAPEEIGKKVR